MDRNLIHKKGNTGIIISHTTIYHYGGQKMANYFKFGKRKIKNPFYSWKMDETYIKIKGKWHYLYRAIDADGLTFGYLVT